MLIRVQDRMFNTDHITFVAYNRETENEPSSVVIHFSSGAHLQFGKPLADTIWQRLGRDIGHSETIVPESA
jgi:hypothetical protein